MNEPPGARARVALTGLTVAEYLDKEGQDVFFLLIIYSDLLKLGQVSALLGRIPSAVGYQPTLLLIWVTYKNVLLLLAKAQNICSLYMFLL